MRFPSGIATSLGAMTCVVSVAMLGLAASVDGSLQSWGRDLRVVWGLNRFGVDCVGA